MVIKILRKLRKKKKKWQILMQL